MSRVNRANKKIKIGDMVRVITGKDASGKGKTGKVLKIIAKTDRVLIEKINMVKKHQKGDDKGNQGGIIEKEASIHLSNVALVSSSKAKSSKPTVKKTVKKAANKTTKKTSTKKAESK